MQEFLEDYLPDEFSKKLLDSYWGYSYRNSLENILRMPLQKLRRITLKIVEGIPEEILERNHYKTFRQNTKQIPE